MRAQGGLADQQAGEGAGGVHVVLGQHADGLQLGVVEQVGFVQDEDRGAAPFGLFGGQPRRFGGRGWRGAPTLPAERGDDLVVDAADPDGGVGQVDDRIARIVQCGQCGADGDGLAGADFAGDDADAAFGDAPADAGDGLAVSGMAVQHAGGEIAAEGHAGEPVKAMHFLDHGVTSRPVSRSSCLGISSCVPGSLPARAA